MMAKTSVIYASLLIANAAAWAWAWIAFAERPALLGTSLLAYLFGLRHAFDADHIAAIDNAVRKLTQEGKAPWSAGLFFSLGHSTIVAFASVAIAATAAAMQRQLETVHDLTGTIGTTLSAFFLLAIGAANLIVLRSVWSAFAKARMGKCIDDEDLDARLAGFFTRIFRPLFRVVSRSWHMYPIGFLFGLGFDTATEIGVLGVSATQAARGLSMWSILVFPALFTAGMSLMDTTDSVLMTRAYGWAFINPVRKLWYNLTITAASVLIAFLIGGVEALTLVRDKLRLEGTFWRAIGSLNENLTNFGFVVLGIFIASWLVSALVYRASGHESLQAERL